MGGLDVAEDPALTSSSLTLLQLLSNPLILYETLQWLPAYSRLDLGATSKAFKELVYNTPQVFRHLDLTPFKAAQSAALAIDHGRETWRSVELDENSTDDE